MNNAAGLLQNMAENHKFTLPKLPITFPAIRPAMCAISATVYAPTSSAIAFIFL